MVVRLKICHAVKLAFIVILNCPVQQCQVGVRILGGEVAEIKDVPYHVAIYEQAKEPGNFKQICGGTLISETHVITAAHCVWDETLRAPKPSNRFRVVAGKTHIAWSTPEDPQQQAASSSISSRSSSFRSSSSSSSFRSSSSGSKSSKQQQQETEQYEQRRSVSHVAIPRRYHGITLSYAFDVALLTLEQGVTWTERVAPALVDWGDEWAREQLVVGRNGTVAGWGISESGRPSTILRSARLPYVTADTCFDSLPLDQKRFVTQDKFCAGFLERSTSVCSGDSGGGLVFLHPATGRRYLRGVVSVSFRPAANKEKCYAQHYTAFTLVEGGVVRDLLDSSGGDVPATVKQPECGRRGRTATPLVAGGVPAEVSEFPWHAGVYRTRGVGLVYVSGGTLVSAKLVVTSALYFYTGQGQKSRDASDIRLALGGVDRYDSDTPDAGSATDTAHGQMFRVAKVAIHPDFAGGRTDFANNVAVLQMVEAATMTATVAPVCVDWDSAHEGELRVGVKGVVAGFGNTEADPAAAGQGGSRPLGALRWVEMPYASLVTCTAYAQGHPSQQYLAHAHLFCAGEVNKTRGLCRGDGGGGYHVLHVPTNRYFLRGVASLTLGSTGPRVPGFCPFAEGYAVFTRLAPFLSWLRPHYDAAAAE